MLRNFPNGILILDMVTGIPNWILVFIDKVIGQDRSQISQLPHRLNY
jgi:hypothetical protein